MLTKDIRVQERSTGRQGTIKVLPSLDWAEVEWDDAPGARLALVHTSKLEAIPEDES